MLGGRAQVTPASAAAPLLGGHSHGGHSHGGHSHEHQCDSHAHSPGQCHGFEAKLKGNWKEVHGNFTLKDSLGGESAEARKREESRFSLSVSCAAAFVIMLLELGVGSWLGSLALMSDGMHQMSDVALYCGLLYAVLLSARAADLTTYSFGYERAQVLGSLIALLIQYFATGLLLVTAVTRLTAAPKRIDGSKVCLVATVSLASNLLLLRVLPPAHGHGHSHGGGSSESGGAWDVARLHMLGDIVQSGAVILSGAISWADPTCMWADPASTFVYAAVVIATSWNIFQELLGVLMERTPVELNTEELYQQLSNIKGVIDAHCVHVWVVAPGKIAMSGHLHVQDDMHEEVLHAAQILMRHKYGIVHSTIQVSDDDDLA